MYVYLLGERSRKKPAAAGDCVSHLIFIVAGQKNEGGEEHMGHAWNKEWGERSKI